MNCQCYPCWIRSNLPGYQLCPPCLREEPFEAPDDGQPTLTGGWEIADPDYVSIERSQ
jgi:hypothetical protein